MLLVSSVAPMISEHDWKSDCRLTAPRPVVAWQAGQATVAKMELEVSYDENYCMEGRAERRRGATDSIDDAREAVRTLVGREAALQPHHSHAHRARWPYRCAITGCQSPSLPVLVLYRTAVPTGSIAFVLIFSTSTRYMYCTH